MGTGPIIGSCAVVDLGFNFGEDWNVAKNKNFKATRTRLSFSLYKLHPNVSNQKNSTIPDHI